MATKKVLKTASLPSTESILLQMQLRWAGHVSRMEGVRKPKPVFFSEFQEGKRDRCAPKKIGTQKEKDFIFFPIHVKHKGTCYINSELNFYL